ncbi:MAG: hypothetical protein FWH27_13375 [Planctomycetaceae bacterium]|nr:hypothetical protein [Planctomycetaceae bacterium]
MPPAQQGATSATTGEKAVLQGRDALRLPGVERMQLVLRGLIFDDCVSSLTTSKKDKAIGRKIKNDRPGGMTVKDKSNDTG